MTAEELVAALVSIDSVNPALVPGGAGEAEMAAFVEWVDLASVEACAAALAAAARELCA